MMENNIHVFSLFTDINLKQEEISFFRGAMICLVGVDKVLFHDHEKNGLRYSYPLVQYKIIEGKAAIIAIGGGVASVEAAISCVGKTLQVGRRKALFNVVDTQLQRCLITITENTHIYRLSHWLPLNQNNYGVFSTLESLREKCTMLERLLIGNILSFAKGIGVYFDEEIKVSIVDIEKAEQYLFKNVKMLGFDVVFRTNVLLPRYVGVGKGVSLGFGMITIV